MSYGGITFEHVWAYQIKCMMANQYNRLIEAIDQNDVDLIIAVCLRLGWNDAFKHVSKNVDTDTTISEISKLTSVEKWRDVYNFIIERKKNYKGKNFEISDKEKDDVIFLICLSLVTDFKEYLNKKDTRDRIGNISNLLGTPNFKNKFSPIKDINYENYELCFGHIQKMFNMATKLLLCLIMSAEFADRNKLKVKLEEFDEEDALLLTSNSWWENEEFEVLRNENFDADCPIDSIILDAIENRKINKLTSGHNKYSQIVWSKLGTKEPVQNYEFAQTEIKNINDKAHPNSTSCNLLFDFENWN